MRIADKTVYDQINSSISKNRTDLARLQTQSSTQKKVNKPSDDPLAATRVLGARTEVQTIDQYKKNTNYARSFLDYSDQSLGELTEVIQRAKELAIGQANDASSNMTTRKVAASEVDQLFNQAVQIGNRKLGDRFLFGGYQTVDIPFDTKGGYSGDAGEILIQINKEGFVTLNIPGNHVFYGESPSSDNPSSKMAPASSFEENSSQNPSFIQNSELERHPSSLRPPDLKNEKINHMGVNIFQALKELQSGFLTNDKQTIFNSLDRMDEALEQVILARSQVGARIMGLDRSMETLQKSSVNSKIAISDFEDADIFETVTDINKAENALQATLSTSGKLIQPSLLDFLR